MKRFITIAVAALIAVAVASPSFAKEEKIPQIILVFKQLERGKPERQGF